MLCDLVGLDIAKIVLLYTPDYIDILEEHKEEFHGIEKDNEWAFH